MARKRPRRLVIDASVARCAGPSDSQNPRAKACRDFLKSVLDICYHVVWTKDIMEEWTKHQGSYARKWRLSMEAKKKVYRPSEEEIPSLQVDLQRAWEKLLSHEKAGLEGLLKDARLIEGALRSDKIVVSLDDKARRAFGIVAADLGRIRGIVWVNPQNEDEQPIAWLENGARLERARRLK